MDNMNITLGSIKARDVLRDGIGFGRQNYGKLLILSLPMFGVMVIYYLLVFGIVGLGSFSGRNPGNYPLRMLLMMLNVPLSLGGAFLMSLFMVSFVKRLNAAIRGEELSLRDSFKGSAITALKIYGASILGVLIIYVPLIILVPAGTVFALAGSLIGSEAGLAPIVLALLILVVTIFTVVFVLWAFYIGIHLYALIITLILDSKVTKWVNWTRKLVKGQIRNIVGVMSAIYGVYLFIGLAIAVPSLIFYRNMIFFPMISSVVVILVSLFLYPFIFSIIIILYYRLKTVNWDEISVFIYQKSTSDAKPITETAKEDSAETLGDNYHL